MTGERDQPIVVRPRMTLQERQAARTQLRERAAARAITEADCMYRTLACHGDFHTTCPGEYLDGCLCECHDPAPSTQEGQ